MNTSELENIPKNLFVFSTVDRFQSVVRNKLKEYLTNITKIEIYLLKCEEFHGSDFLSRALVLLLKIPVKIETIVNELHPPVITCHDVIVDAIANDPDLQPLKGGFDCLERLISRSEALVHRI